MTLNAKKSTTSVQVRTENERCAETCMASVYIPLSLPVNDLHKRPSPDANILATDRRSGCGAILPDPRSASLRKSWSVNLIGNVLLLLGKSRASRPVSSLLSPRNSQRVVPFINGPFFEINLKISWNFSWILLARCDQNSPAQDNP